MRARKQQQFNCGTKHPRHARVDGQGRRGAVQNDTVGLLVGLLQLCFGYDSGSDSKASGNSRVGGNFRLIEGTEWKFAPAAIFTSALEVQLRTRSADRSLLISPTAYIVLLSTSWESTELVTPLLLKALVVVKSSQMFQRASCGGMFPLVLLQPNATLGVPLASN